METKHKGDKRKLWLLLPLLVAPFLAFAFYKLDGGKAPLTGDIAAAKGINTELPNAAMKAEQPISKIGYYQQADRDSAKAGRLSPREVGGSLALRGVGEDPQTKAINSRLELLSREISKPVEESKPAPAAVKPVQPGMKNDVDRLEALMKTMQEDKGGEDHEMTQLAAMMNKLIAVQNPELAKQIYKKPGTTVVPDSLFKAIPAVISAEQKVVQGATVKLVLRDSLRLKGMLIPKGHELFGTCRITNQRLLLDIKNIRMGNSIIPVDLSVWSLDGMVGLDAPEAVLIDAVNEGTDDAMRNVGLMGFDQSLGIQVAGAGIDAAKKLLSKKLRRVKVKLRQGQPVLLRNNALKSKIYD